MKNNLSKIVTIVIAVIAVIGIALFINVYIVDDGNPEILSGAVSKLVGFSFWFFIISVFVAVLLSLWSLVKNPAALKEISMGLAVMIVLLVISYSVASGGEVIGPNKDVLISAGSISKWVSTGLTYSFILGIIGGALFLYDLIKGLVK